MFVKKNEISTDWLDHQFTIHMHLTIVNGEIN